MILKYQVSQLLIQYGDITRRICTKETIESYTNEQKKCIYALTNSRIKSLVVLNHETNKDQKKD